jgi:hypothetical protein
MVCRTKQFKTKFFKTYPIKIYVIFFNEKESEEEMASFLFWNKNESLHLPLMYICSTPFLQLTHWPPGCSLSTLGTLLPQGLCTCSLFLDHLSLIKLYTLSVPLLPSGLYSLLTVTNSNISLTIRIAKPLPHINLCTSLSYFFIFSPLSTCDIILVSLISNFLGGQIFLFC